MEELFIWIENYEVRNDFCISVIFHGDKSGHVSVFTDESDVLFGFDNIDELREQLLSRKDN